MKFYVLKNHLKFIKRQGKALCIMYKAGKVCPQKAHKFSLHPSFWPLGQDLFVVVLPSFGCTMLVALLILSVYQTMCAVLCSRAFAFYR